MPKGIFIGLGGAGITTVARLKALLFQRAYSFDKNAMDAECSFIFYDTDEMSVRNALSDVELQQMMGGYPVVDMSKEFIDAGCASPYNMYLRAKQASDSDEIARRMLEWAIDTDVQGHYQLPQKPLKEGAGAQRMAGRMGFVFKKDEFEEKIRFGLSKFREQLFDGGDNLEVEHPSIWVFSSSNGGTSSSALLDVLYLIDRLYKREIANVDPDLRLVLYMPKAFMDLNLGGVYNTYALNAYSTLWELNAFRADAVLDNDGKKFGAFAVQPDRREWADLFPWKVCHYVMAVDAESNDGRRVRIDQMYANTAEMCYFMHAGPAGQKMESLIDPIFCPGGPFYGTYRNSYTDKFKWSNFVVGSGYKAINKADDFLKEYVRRRFRYDVYGYGLIGLDFDKILPNEKDRLKAAKEFATEYIMDHLVNMDRFGMSARNSLYGMCDAAFGIIMLPPAGIVPSKEDWFNMGVSFITECKAIAHRLSVAFDDPASPYSKTSWLSKIEQSVKEGLEKCIVDFGLKYAYSLISMVDDDYLEREVLGHLEPKDNMHELECQIEDIIQSHGRPLRPFSRRKAIVELVAMMDEYKKACIEELAINHIREIIKNLTTGLLEYLRKGVPNHLGLRGLIEHVRNEYGYSVMACRELATTFRKTANDVCNDYLPPVHEFVNQDETWKSGHMFESLYDSILPLDSSISDAGNDNAGFARRPIRSEMARILNDIKEQAKTNGREFRFADVVLCQPEEAPDELKTIMLCVDGLIEDFIHSYAYPINAWLDKPLESVFDECFVKDGIIDMTAKQEYCNSFSHSVPVFYPIAPGTTMQVETRRLYVGNSPEFAHLLLGYETVPGSQFVQDSNLDHRFVVIKYEVGHNFYDYKYFDRLSSIYEQQCEQIERGPIGCHIHKEFVYRDIAKAYENLNCKHEE